MLELKRSTLEIVENEECLGVIRKAADGSVRPVAVRIRAMFPPRRRRRVKSRLNLGLMHKF